MCGIFFHNFNSENKSEYFLNSLKHRGPNYCDKKDYLNFTIGHTLLSIRGDVENSKQPQTTKSGRYIFAFNGQIYNTSEISKLFHINFNENIDTKILSDLIDIKGHNFSSHIDGMFSIILLDKKENKLFLYRDNSGQKPLYYFIKNKKIICCSEITPIINSLSNSKQICEEAFTEILNFGTTVSKRTLFKNIHKVLPGEKISINLKNFYYNKEYFLHNVSFNNDYKLDEIISETIHKHLQTKNKIGINLSGGLDSNIILYETLKKNSSITVFSTKFENSDNIYNHDFNLAKEVANFYQIPFIETEVSSNNFKKVFYDSFSNIEEVNFNINNPAYMINYQNQKNHGFKSILSGDGGDELFIGYNWYRGYKKFEKLMKLISSEKRFSSFKTINYLREFQRYNLMIKYSSFKKNNFSLFLKSLKTIFFANKQYNDYFKKNYTLEKNSPDWDISKLFIQQYFWLSNEVLLRADKLGMQNSLEIRSPFCDYNLRYYMLKNTKIEDFKTDINKPNLRYSYKDKLYKKISNNKIKSGWTVPREWLKDKFFRDMFMDLTKSFKSDILNWEEIRNYISINDDFMLNKRIYGILSLSILQNKYNFNL